MATKTLSPQACEHFYSLRDALAVYAHDRLGIAEALFIDEEGSSLEYSLFDESVLMDTLQELWSNPAIVEDFIRENPLDLELEDLAILKTWTQPITGIFTAFKHANKVLFKQNNYLFDVTGLSEPVDIVLNAEKFPTIVFMTLLPFDGKVVYDGFVLPSPVYLGEGLLRSIEGDIQEALLNAERVTSAQRLVELAPAIAEKRIQEEADRMIEELELDMQADQQLEGCHEGILAGLSEQERKAAIEAAWSANVSPSSSLMREATKGAPVRDLATLMQGEQKMYLERWAQLCGVQVDSKATKAQLVEALTPNIANLAPVIAIVLHGSFTLKQLRAYRALYEADGVLKVPEQEAALQANLPATARILCYVFYEKGPAKGEGSFTFVIPEQVMGMLDDFDWDALEQSICERQLAEGTAEALVELRGIVGIAEAYAEYTRRSSDPIDQLHFEGVVLGSIRDEAIDCACLDTPDELLFLIAPALASFLQEEYDGFDGEGLALQGPIDPLRFLLENQHGKVARPLDAGMNSGIDVFDWKCSLPAARAVRDYLDAHVPDDQDDYTFADEVVVDLVDFMALGVGGAATVQNYFGILEDHGFLPNEAHMRRLLDLFMNMANSMPCWQNNGWAPSELLELETGRKAFYNEDGSMMKVGRNDPCPCGSGKKYKHCCGKHR